MVLKGVRWLTILSAAVQRRPSCSAGDAVTPVTLVTPVEWPRCTWCLLTARQTTASGKGEVRSYSLQRSVLAEYHSRQEMTQSLG